MSGSERVGVSGAALALLLHECSSAGPHEGFLLGRVATREATLVSDLPQQQRLTHVALHVLGVLPCPDLGLFYGASGRVRPRQLRELLADLAPDVLGWYRFRPAGSHRPTLRDRLVSRELQAAFLPHTRHFLHCSVVSKRNHEKSTHTYSYKFSKLDERGNMNAIEDVTNNLGEKVSGYKNGAKGDHDDPFNVAVRTAAGKGMDGIATAVEEALAAAATEAVDKEKEMKKLTNEIRKILKQLAEHHKNNSILEPTRKAAIKQEERDHIEPILKSAEPFSFVNDIIQHEAKPKAIESDNLFKKQKNSHNEHKNAFSVRSPTSSDSEVVLKYDEFPPLDRMETSNSDRK